MDGKQKILIVDDSEMNRAILTSILGDGYEFIEAENGVQAVKILSEQRDINLVLLDIVMPELNGFGVLSVMNQNHWIDNVPVITISSESDSVYVERAYQLGVTDYIGRPFDKAVVCQRVSNTLMLYAKQKHLMRMVTEQVYKRKKSNSLMLNILSHIVEFKNGESGLHIQHIHTAVELLLRQLVIRTDKYPLTEDDISLISTASALHDIGKINIPDAILNKPGRLTPEEFEIMKTHTTIGASILKSFPSQQDEPLVRVAYEICRWHHERYDGGGYPDGLCGDKIPITAQVVSLADVYDALTSERCYKKAYSPEESIQMILSGECGQFNPLLLDCLLAIKDQLYVKLNTPPTEGNYRAGAQRISDHMFHEDELPYANSTQYQLACERAKRDFYMRQANGMVFDYDATKGTISVSDYTAVPPYENQISDIDTLARRHSLSAEDLKKLENAVTLTTPESPDASITANITVDGKPTPHRIAIRTLWSREQSRRFIGTVGFAHSLDEQHTILSHLNMDISNTSAPEAKLILHELHTYFDKARLVDPNKFAVMRIKSDGSISADKNPCYAIWNSREPCVNCAGCKALSSRNRSIKLELTNTGIYQVIAMPVVIEGHALILELISRSDTGVWFNEQGKELLLEKYGRDFYTDSLTGAYCRQYFEDQRSNFENSDGIVMIDVDHFKHVNDTYGHLVGDVALKKIASAILSCIRSSDTLIRYGGDEFLILFPQIQKEALDRKLRYIQNAVSHAVVDDYPDIHLSISIGGVFRVKPLMEAVRQADQLMYQDKASKGMLR